MDEIPSRSKQVGSLARGATGPTLTATVAFLILGLMLSMSATSVEPRNGPDAVSWTSAAGLVEPRSTNEIPTGPVPYWSPVYPANLPPYPVLHYADSGGFVYDAADGYDILLEFPVLSPPGTGYFAGPAQTWTYSGGVWTNRTSTAGPEPLCCAEAPMIYDQLDRAVIFVTANISSGNPVQTWSFAHGSWSLSTVGGPPRNVDEYRSAYDASDGYALLFGGLRWSGAAWFAVNYTWSYGSGIWNNLTPTLSVSPPPDECLDVETPGHPCAAMTYDGSSRAVVLFGVGFNPLGGSPSTSQTWEFSGGRWTNATASSGPAPPPNIGIVFTYDKQHNLSLWRASNCLVACATTTWAYESGRWAPLTPFVDPIASESAFQYLTFDGVSDRLFLLTLHGAGYASWEFQIGLLPAGPSILAFTASPAITVLGSRISLNVGAAGGLGQLAFGYDDLPPGCATADTSMLSCVPTVTGSFRVSVTVGDITGRFARAVLTLTVLSLVDVTLIGAVLTLGAVTATLVVIRVRVRRRRRSTGGTASDSLGARPERIPGGAAAPSVPPRAKETVDETATRPPDR